MQNEERLVKVYENILQYGFTCVKEVPATEESTKALFERVCRMSKTLYGDGMWEMGTNFDHPDAGYQNGYLEAHTDNTSHYDPQG